MPNYKLGPTIIDHMKARATALCERRVSYMQCGFPISKEKVQAAILPIRWRETVLEMKRDGVAALNTTNALSLLVDLGFSDTPRAAQVKLFLPDVSPYSDMDRDKRFQICSSNPGFDTEPLTDAERVALTKWVNTIVTERRLANIAKKAITGFLEKHALTTGHVLARWPMVVSLIDASKVGHYQTRDREIVASFRQRFNDPPKTLKPYLWSDSEKLHGWPAKNKGAMRVAETVIASASMLPEEVKDQAEVHATIQSWRPAPGDLDKP